MNRLIHQKRINIRKLAQNKNPKVIPVLKRIACNQDEHAKVRKEAMASIGSFGGLAVEPLTDLLFASNDKDVKKTAAHLLHAFEKKEMKHDWTAEMKENLATSITAASLILEGLMS